MKQTSDEKRRMGAPKVPRELIQRIVEKVKELEDSKSEAESRPGRQTAGGERR